MAEILFLRYFITIIFKLYIYLCILFVSQTGPVIPMPVPSSFNDITQDKSLRDFVGWVWYDTEFYASMDWITLQKRVVLRFDSAHYYSIVVSFPQHKDNSVTVQFREGVSQNTYFMIQTWIFF